jgi:hypothetical protein
MISAVAVRIIITLATILMIACGPGVPARSGSESSELDSLRFSVTYPVTFGADDTVRRAGESPAELELRYDTLYVTVADTGHSYLQLDSLMHVLAMATGRAVDMGGRVYDVASDSIILPRDNEDVLYAGHYIVRRFPSATLSIEYLDWYVARAEANTMALVTGLWIMESDADSALAAVRHRNPRAFKLKSVLYQGCIH